MTVRRMFFSDYEAVYNLWLSCKGMGLNDVDDSKEGITRFLARNPDTCFVAEMDNRVVGVIMAGSDGRRGYIYHAAVHSDYRKQGIGSSLVNTALNALKQIGISKVALVVFERNREGNAFWKKQGFTARTDLTYRTKLLLRQNDMIHKRQADRCMERFLQASKYIDSDSENIQKKANEIFADEMSDFEKVRVAYEFVRDEILHSFDYNVNVLKAEKLFEGHNPQNAASQKVLAKLGFIYVRNEYYEPTGLCHPSYELNKENLK